jgi:glycosyltransferase involved in cell wall biosynthesis
MKIGVARYPYFRQTLKGGDHVLFDAIVAALGPEHDIQFVEYKRPLASLLPALPALVAKIWVWLADLLLPFLFTRQLLSRLDEFDLILADSAVVTRLPFRREGPERLVAVINIDYHAYLAAVGEHLAPSPRAVLRWKSWMQDRGLAAIPSVAVSRFVAETAGARGVQVSGVVENQVQDLPEGALQPAERTGLVYAGSGDYWGKGLDVLQALSARGLPLHTYSPANIPGCISHGAVRREILLGALPAYQAMVFPSRYESFGLVVIEALASGVPVLMRRTGVGADLACVLPECVLADNATAEDWEKAIDAVLNDRERIVREGHVFAKAYLDRVRFDRDWREMITRLGTSASSRK